MPLIPAMLLLAFFVRPGLGDLSGDSARYLLLGRALASGQGYVEIEKPGAPPHTEYAPGLPALIALCDLVSSSLLLPKLLIALCWIAVVFLAGLLAREHQPLRQTAAVILVPLTLAAMPNPARFANQALSDLPYAALSLLALLYLARLGNRDEERLGRWALAGGLAALAFFFRQAGVTLWAGAAAALVLRRSLPWRRRLLPLAALSLAFWLPAAAWLVRNLLVAGAVDPGHAGKLFMAQDANPFLAPLGYGGVLARGLRGPADYFRETGSIVLDLAAPLVPRWLGALVAAGLIVPALFGLGVSLRRRPDHPEAWYLIFYLALVSVWQSHNPRYLLPVLPLALIFAAEGIKAGAELTRRLDPGRALKLLAMVALGVNVGVFAVDAVLVVSAPATPLRDRSGRFLSPDGPELLRDAGEIHWGRWYQYPDLLRLKNPAAVMTGYHRLLAAAARLKELPPSAVVVTRKPPLVAWLSGRHAIQYPPEPDPDRFLAALRERGATHILQDEVSPEVRTLFERVRAARPEAFRTVFRLGGTELIEVRGRD
jgi:hypothetical protein